jgi:hypothetical protein
MLDMLRQYPAARLPSYSQVRDYIRSRTAAWLPRQDQTPGIFGDAAYEFFGPKLLPWTPSCHITKKCGEYILAAGKAQGVAPGAIYELLPEGWEASTEVASGPSERRPLQVRVKEVFDLRSKAAAVSEGDIPHIDKLIGLGHHAMRHKWALPTKTYVDIGIDNPRTVDQAYLDEFRASLKKELESTPNLLLKTHEIVKQEDIKLIMYENRTVEIRSKGGQPLVGLPRISLRDSGATGRLVDVLNHTARFQAIKELRYGRPTALHLLAQDRFRFGAYDSEGEPVSKNDAGQYMATHGQRLNLVFEPTEGSEPLYVSVFDLAAESWAVTKMYPPQTIPPYQLQHPEPVVVDTRMIIPAQYSHAIDTIRAYVYAGPNLPSWDELQLQAISSEAVTERQDVHPEDDGRFAEADNSLKDDGRWAVVDFTIVTTRSDDIRN